MPITAQTIINKVSTILNDATSVRWSASELLGYLNEAQKEIALNRPDASVFNGSITLTANTTKQTLPADGVRLVSVVRNTGNDGLTAGRAIRLVDRTVLDTNVPDWHSSSAANDVAHYVFDPLNPKIYYVYPRPAAGRQVEIIYQSVPADCALTDAIKIDDIYANAIANYIFYRAYSKDADYSQNMQLAMGYMTTFMQQITGKTAVDAAIDPNARPPMKAGFDK